MGLLDSFIDDADTRQNLGSGLGALGLALASSPNNAPFANLPQAFAIMGQNQKTGMSKAALKQLLIQAGYGDAEAETYSSDPKVAQLAMDQAKVKQQAAHGVNIARALGGGADAPTSSPSMTPAAPAGPASGVSLNGDAPALTGTGGEIQTKFVDGLKSGGLTNPYGLAAVAAYGQHESRYDPGNVNRTWADPSESGQAGTSGGILSWRADRLAKMQAATKGAADPVVAQAQFTLQENPELTAKLQQAKSPEEANALMAQAWKFAGYDRPGGEYAARLATTRSYANRFTGAGTPPTQVADASGAVPAAPISGINPAVSMPNGRPQVANSEQETQALEGRMGMYPPNVYGITPETRGAVAQADMPAPDAVPAGLPTGAGKPSRDQTFIPPAPRVLPGTPEARAAADRQAKEDQVGITAAGAGMAAAHKRAAELAALALNPNTTPQQAAVLSDERKRILDAAAPTQTARELMELGLKPGTKAYMDAYKQKMGLNKVDADFEPDPENGGVRPVRGGKNDPRQIAAEAQARQSDAGAKINSEVAAREQEGLRLGMKPGSDELRGYAATGRIPKEDQQTISASDRKVINEAEDRLPALENTRDTLKRALELNGKTYTGRTAAALAAVGTSGIPGSGLVADGQKARDTREFNNIMSGEAIAAMSNQLKGATSEKEMAMFVQLMGDPSTPPEVRKTQIERMQKLAERQYQIAQDRIKELRGSVAPKSAAQPTQSAAPAGVDPALLAEARRRGLIQ